MSIIPVFQNEHLVAVDKPHGWLTTPAREKSDPRPCLGLQLQDQLKQQIYPVHRLDFEVSGLVLFALTKDAHRDSQKWFEDELVQKTYQALSTGSAQAGDWQEWKSKLVRGKRRTFEAAHGKDSKTRARVIQELDRYLQWELMPLTGRPHQLRFEMSKRGYPILGDTLYGGQALKVESCIALRAVKLDFGACDSGRFGLPTVFSVPDLKLP